MRKEKCDQEHAARVVLKYFSWSCQLFKTLCEVLSTNAEEPTPYILSQP